MPSVSNFRLYRKIERGEFFVVFGDTAQGGIDKNFTQFMSQTRIDIPLVFSMNGVAAEATPYIHQALEWLYDQTDVRPVFAFERQNGGASEMHNLMMMNKNGKYILYQLTDESGKPSGKYGWDTNIVTRPKMIGDWKVAVETKQVKIYDQETIEHHQTFITNAKGKPEAAPNTHDDGVMSCAGVWQLYQTESPQDDDDEEQSSGNLNTLWG
jgi:hypothetical protein